MTDFELANKRVNIASDNMIEAYNGIYMELELAPQVSGYDIFLVEVPACWVCCMDNCTNLHQKHQQHHSGVIN